MNARATFPEADKLAYTVAEACAATGLSDDTLYRKHAAGEITMKKVGRRTLILREDFQKLVAARDAKAAADIEAASAIPPCGVYILFLAGAVAYIGRSKNIRSRLANHRQAGRQFDDFQVIACDAKTSDWLEREMIRTLNPAQNRMLYRRHSKAMAKDLQAAGIGDVRK